jgi:dGTP triphosphohydrolase
MSSTYSAVNAPVSTTIDKYSTTRKYLVSNNSESIKCVSMAIQHGFDVDANTLTLYDLRCGFVHVKVDTVYTTDKKNPHPSDVSIMQREDDIMSLTQTVHDREREINSLTESLAQQVCQEREIVSLKASLAQQICHEEEIASLKASLAQQICHEEEIASLKASLAQQVCHEEEIAYLKASLKQTTLNLKASFNKNTSNVKESLAQQGFYKKEITFLKTTLMQNTFDVESKNKALMCLTTAYKNVCYENSQLLYENSQVKVYCNDLYAKANEFSMH